MNDSNPDFTFDPSLRDVIAARLQDFPVKTLQDEGLRRAAVALVIAPHPQNGEAALVLTKRPKTIKRHSGQYAWPGGRLEEGETPPEAALRELHEEVGLALEAEAILGPLDDFPTRSGFCITPIVAWGGTAPQFNPDPNEVARILHIPFHEMNDPAIPYLDTQGEGEPVMSAPLATLGHHLYAPSAALLYQFREVALRGLTTRVAHYEQPKFAWS